jgi:hypothetical protein
MKVLAARGYVIPGKQRAKRREPYSKKDYTGH